MVQLEHLAQEESPVLGDRVSRSIEGFSPKREVVKERVLCLSRRLGKRSCFGRGMISLKQEGLA